jgi:hypothetical protein
MLEEAVDDFVCLCCGVKKEILRSMFDASLEGSRSRWSSTDKLRRVLVTHKVAGR